MGQYIYILFELTQQGQEILGVYINRYNAVNELKKLLDMELQKREKSVTLVWGRKHRPKRLDDSSQLKFEEVNDLSKPPLRERYLSVEIQPKQSVNYSIREIEIADSSD